MGPAPLVLKFFDSSSKPQAPNPPTHSLQTQAQTQSHTPKPQTPNPTPHPDADADPTKAAYYELFGRVVCVYEPVQTKSFLHGRTEAARTMTAEAAHFVRPGTSPQ